jgi:hypothetical protein
MLKNLKGWYRQTRLGLEVLRKGTHRVRTRVARTRTYVSRYEGKPQPHCIDLKISEDKTVVEVYNGLCGSQV